MGGCASSPAAAPASASGKPPKPQAQGEGSDSETDEMPRMLLVSSNLPDYEVVLQAATSNVVVVAVQYDSWSIEDLKAAIIKRADEPDGDFSSIGIFDHGAPGEFCLLKSVKGGSIDLADTLSLFEENEVIAFIKWLATYLDKDEDPRIDLLGCSIAKGARGEGLIAHLEKEIGVNFAASTDDTGVGKGAENGKDFVMETEGDEFNVVDLYFEEDQINLWQHTARGWFEHPQEILRRTRIRDKEIARARARAP